MNLLRMDITTKAGALFDNPPRLKNKALLLDITVVNPCAGSNLGIAARHVGKHLADAVERKKNKYRGSFPATYSLFPLATSTCCEVGSDVNAIIKELAIRRVQHRSETHSNKSQHLAEGTEVARLWRRFSFVLQQALSFRTRHHFCRQGVALESTQQLRSQSPVSVHAHGTKGITESEETEEANGDGGGIGVGGGIGDGNRVRGGNGDVNGGGDGAGEGMGTASEVEVNEGAQDGNGTGTGVETRGQPQDGNEDESGDQNESSFGDENGDEGENGGRNEGGIEEGAREMKKHKKPRRNNGRRDQVLLFRTRHHLGRQGVALAGTRHPRSQGLMPVHAHRTERVTGPKRQEGSNEVGSGIGVGGGNGEGNRVRGGDGARRGTGKGAEVNEGAHNGNGDGSADVAGTGTGMGVESLGRTQDGNENGSGDGNEINRGDGNGDEDGNENDDRMGEGGREAKKHKKPHRACRRHVGNRGDLGG